VAAGSAAPARVIIQARTGQMSAVRTWLDGHGARVLAVGSAWLVNSVTTASTIAGTSDAWDTRIIWGHALVGYNDPALGRLWGDRIIWGNVVDANRIIWGNAATVLSPMTLANLIQ
jgi:hypothetical protein